MRTALACLLFLLAAALAPCGGRIVVLCYNVQNLFDDRVDGSEYPEYRPPQWDRDLAEAKLAALGRAIRRASRAAPDLIALQEVENLSILLRLRDGHLASYGYRYAILAGQDGVATRTAVLSRLPVVRTAVHAAGWFAGYPLRHILEVEIEHQGHRLIVLNNHWKSKTGGVEATAEGRRLAAAVVRRRVEQLLREDPAADILVLGDMNENLGELNGEIRPCADPREAGPGSRGLGLYEPWYELPPERRGSAVYQGQWQTPDHMLLAPGLFDRLGFSYRAGSFRVVRQPHLLARGSGFPLRFRPERRPHGGGGTSDHLPLLLEIEVH
ncbi:MAG: hypothetical protein JW820_01075 [Spirochaetales bacterium]|nr:hypothetical protein [Spirochaetales bacterium]